MSKRLVRRIAPELGAHPRVQGLGEGLGQAVGQRRGHDRRIVVARVLEGLGDLGLAVAGGDREAADPVGRRSPTGATKSASATLARAPCRLSLAICWRRVWKPGELGLAGLVRIETMSSPSALAGQKPTTPRASNHFSPMIRCSMAWASANRSRAASPTTSSSRICG